MKNKYVILSAESGSLYKDTRPKIESETSEEWKAYYEKHKGEMKERQDD